MGRLIKKDSLPHLPLEMAHADRPLFNLIDAQQSKAQFVAQAKEGIIELSIKMAKKIVGQALQTDPVCIEQWYSDAIAQVSTLQPGKIFVHPNGLDKTTIEKTAIDAGFSVVKDETLAPHDCIVEASGVRVDSTLDTAFYLLKKAMSHG